MNTYMLVTGEGVPTQWVWAITEYKRDDVVEACNRWHTSIGYEIINGRKGLTLGGVSNWTERYISNMVTHLKGGETVLVNHKGGCMLLKDSMTVLKTVQDVRFPYDGDHKGVNGWLAPSGQFHACEHGEHYKFARNFDGSAENEDEYIRMSSCREIDSSVVDIRVENITDAQRKWLLKNYEQFDDTQVKDLERSGVVK